MTKTKLKKFILNVQVDSFVTVEIKAENIKAALEIAEGLSTQEVWDYPGTREDESHKIVGIFEG
jgi:hypothetical protein